MPIDTAQIQVFVLVFLRVASALSVLPVFGHGAFPPIGKAGLSAALSLLLVPALALQLPPVGGTTLEFFLLGIREVLCGVLLGLAGQFVFWAVEVAGQLIGFQAGFSIITSIDPNTDAQSTVLTQVYNLVALLVFLSIDGHHVMLRAIADSLRAVPIGGLNVGAPLTEWAVFMAKGVLADGVRMAAPIMVTLLLTDVGLGILVRVAPTMNVFVLGFPLKVAVALILVSLTLGAVMSVFTFQFADFTRHMPSFLKLLSVP